MTTPAVACNRLLDWMPPRWVLLVLLCGVALFRGRYIERHHEIRDPDGYGDVAWRIYNDHSIAIHSARIGMTWATAARPPLYPLVLSSAHFLGLEPYRVAALLHAALAMLTVWGVWHLGRLWELRPGVTLIAGALVTVDPILLAQSTQLMTETMATALATLTLVAWTCFARAKTIPWAIGAGLLGGLSVLCRPEFLAWVALCALAYPLVMAPPRRFARLAILWAALVATLAPWAVRNYRLLGAPVVATTHGGVTLLLANNPRFYAHLRDAPWGTSWDGRAIYEQYFTHMYNRAAQLRYVDELEADRWAYGQALKNIRAEPAMFAWSCVVRAGRLWNVLPHQLTPDEPLSRRGLRYAVAIGYAVELALAGIGAWFLRKKLWRQPLVWSTLLVLSLTAVHAVYWSDMRMRAPLVPVVCLVAADALATLACGKRDATRLRQEA
ncbi:MAG TPA: glycosyltransferase family 39 protein [Pirellulales bacterium]|nr:glycosyltransferase family 39 protein [Pirellulales bacterium]